MPKKLETMDAETLMTTPMEPLKFIVSGLLPQGLHVLAGSPKIGKSWLSLWICLQVAKGEKVWEFETLQSEVLYLCLEDSFARIQNRLFEITDEAPPTLHFAIMSDAIGSGLEMQIEDFLKEHPRTRLIVIDTLQKVRKSISANVNPYAADYDDINALKQIADRHSIAIVLVHHLRKTGDTDPLNMISGTSGIAGGADSNFVLQKDKRTENTATLICTGRDIEGLYLGHTISLKTTTISYKNKKKIERPKSDQLRFENTHEALIDKTTWEIVQHIRQHKRRRANMAEQNIFSGLVYCMDCGGTMVLHRAHTMDAVKNNFMCATYKKKGKERCSAHYIRESQLAEIILDDLRRVTHFARQNELLFAKHITQKNSSEIRRDITQTERELEVMRRRDTELTTLFKRLYEDNVLGKIPNEVFRKLSDDYFVEQKEIQSSIPEREERLEKLKGSVANVSVFLEKAKEYTKLDTLTAELLHLFIEKVVVGERGEKWSRTAVQEIHIYYRDIGLLGDLSAQPMESAKVAESQEVA